MTSVVAAGAASATADAAAAGRTGSAAVLAAVSVVVAAGYVLGSLPTAVLVARRRGVDIRARGDGNPGFWNARAVLGGRAARAVFVVDVAKGALAAGFGVLVARGVARTEPWWFAYLGGAAAMVGHAWPLFAGFRGGRCVLTFLGAFAVTNPPVAAAGLAVAVGLYALLHRFDLAVRVAVFALPVVQAFVDRAAAVACTLAMLCLIGVRFARARPPEAH